MQYARPYRGKRSHIVTGFQGAYTAVCGFTPAPEYADQPGMWYPADPEPSRYYPVCKACEKRDALTAERDTLQATVVQLTKERDEAVRLIVGVATAHNEVEELLNEAQATVSSQAATIGALRELVIDAEWIIDEQVIGTKKFAAGRIPEEWLEEARALLAQPDADPHLPPHESYPVEFEITEVREGKPRVYESDFEAEPAAEGGAGEAE